VGARKRSAPKDLPETDPERLLSETLDACHRAIRGAHAERGDPDGLPREYHQPAGRSGSRDPRRSASGFMAIGRRLKAGEPTRRNG
jgi:hypothetical protein